MTEKDKFGQDSGRKGCHIETGLGIEKWYACLNNECVIKRYKEIYEWNSFISKYFTIYNHFYGSFFTPPVSNLRGG